MHFFSSRNLGKFSISLKKIKVNTRLIDGRTDRRTDGLTDWTDGILTDLIKFDFMKKVNVMLLVRSSW